MSISTCVRIARPQNRPKITFFRYTRDILPILWEIERLKMKPNYIFVTSSLLISSSGRGFNQCGNHAAWLNNFALWKLVKINYFTKICVEVGESAKTNIFGISFKKWFYRARYPNRLFSWNVSNSDLHSYFSKQNLKFVLFRFPIVASLFGIISGFITHRNRIHLISSIFSLVTLLSCAVYCGFALLTLVRNDIGLFWKVLFGSCVILSGMIPIFWQS